MVVVVVVAVVRLVKAVYGILLKDISIFFSTYGDLRCERLSYMIKLHLTTGNVHVAFGALPPS